MDLLILLGYGTFSYLLGICIFAKTKKRNAPKRKEVKNMSVNLNDLAKEVTRKEGKKNSLNIADVKEVIRIVFKELSHMTLEDILGIVKRHK